MNALGRFWHNLVGSQADDGPAPWKYMIRVAYLMMAAALAVSTLIIVAGWLQGSWLPISVVIILSIDLAIGVSWWLVLRGRWQPARSIPSLVFLGLAVEANLHSGLTTSYVVFYALAILLAAVLMGSRAQWLVFLVSIVAYVGAGWPNDFGPAEERLSAAIPVVAVLAGISLLQWLATRQLLRTLAQAESLAARLKAEVAERARAEEDAFSQASMLAALHVTALDLAAHHNLPELFQAIVARAVGLLEAVGGAIYLYRRENDDLHNVLSYNLGQDYNGVALKRGEGLVGRVLDTTRPLCVADYFQWEGRSAQFEAGGAGSFEAAIAAPIQWSGELLGVLSVVDRAPRTFSATDVELLEQFAPLAGAALANARLLLDLQARMEQLQATQSQLVQSARMAAVGELAAGVAHEINNPLTPVLGFSELLLRNPSLDDQARRNLNIVVAEARRARDIVRSLLDFSRQVPCQPLPSDVNQILADTLLLVRTRLGTAGISLHEQFSPNLPLVLLDPIRIKQVWLNLLTNATQAMPGGGRLTISTFSNGSRVGVRIADTGPGIPPEILPRIFEPFFTTRPVGKGTGLGLSVSQGIVHDHGGTIEVDSSPGSGTAITVWLPVAGVA